MERDVAKFVARSAIRQASELGDLLSVVKDHGTSDEFDQFKLVVAELSYEIVERVCRPLFAQHEGLETEIDQQVERYGRVL